MATYDLTPQQQAVVDDRGGALLVSAAAGSGKTMVLVERVLKRVTQEQANLDDFLLITFTQAAAAELRGKLVERLSRELAVRPGDRHLQKQMNRVYLAQISTVHAFCGALLREYGHRLDLPADFRTCDEREAELLRTRAMEQTLEDAYTAGDDRILAALDMLGAGRTDAALPEVILKVYADLQCACDPAQRLRELHESLDTSACTDVGQTVWGAYLLAELRSSLQNCIELTQSAYRAALPEANLAGCAQCFAADEAMLRGLTELQTWTEVANAKPAYCRWPTKEKDNALKEQLHNQRDRIKDIVKKALQRFRLPSEEALADLAACKDALTGLLLLTERFAANYSALKRRRHVLDFNDLEHETLRLLTQGTDAPTPAAREIAQRFTEIMVDEYQDSNAVQETIFRAVSKQGRNLFFVGDVKQSIYRFRRADPTLFLKKYHAFADYTAAADGEPRKILLSVNFRSRPEILAAANDVFRLTMNDRVGGLRYGEAEALRTLSPEPAPLSTPAVELHCIDNEGVQSERKLLREEIEAEFVARRIREMLQNGETIPDGEGTRPVRAGDIMILLRSLSGKAEVYMQALRRYGIRSACGSENIFDTEEIGLVTALLQVVDNPHQDIPLLSVLLSPIFSFRADTLARLRAVQREGDVFDALCAAPEAADFLQTLTGLRDLAQTSTLRELLDVFDERLYLRAIFSAMDGGAQRIENLEAFFALADSFETETRRGLPAFLRHLDALREKGCRTQAAAAPDAVRLMTIHSSKGLEFPVVFLADLGKQFNMDDARAAVLTDSELGLASNVLDAERGLVYPSVARLAISSRKRRETLSEEMRLLYVAMTRPKYRLVMSFCTGRLQALLTRLSQSLSVPLAQATVEGAVRMGDWVLMAALTRTEAGALFAVAGNPGCACVSQYPWRITYQSGNDFIPSAQAVEENSVRDETPLLLPELLRYAHPAATAAPSKLTATQLKGRSLDDEVAEQTVRVPELTFAKPRFTSGLRPLTPAERGTAMHLAMQFLRYERCTSLDGILAELKRLTEQGFLTQQQGEAVRPEKLLAFFTSETGRRVLSAKRLVREFKFSVLQDAALLGSALAGEQVLLQGVTDCCIVEDDGLTILDFKSDRVAPGQERTRGEYYRGQLDAYSLALARIFELPVKERILWFFSTDTAVCL